VIAVCADDTNCYRGALHALANCLIEWPLPVLPESPAGLSQGSALGVRRDKAALSSGCKAHPAFRSSRKRSEQSWR